MTDPRQRTFARKDVDAAECPKLGAAGAQLVESSDFAHLTGSLRNKCYDEALRERVRQQLVWDKIPTAGFLWEEIQNHLMRAKAAALAPPPVKPARRALEDPVKTKCKAAASKVAYDAATGETQIIAKGVVVGGLRAIGVSFLESHPGPSEVVAALARVAWSENEERPAHLAELFTKVVAMSDADRRALVERTKAAERKRKGFASSTARSVPAREPPKRRGRSPSPPPAKRVTKSKAKPAPLANQDSNEGEPDVATAEPSSEIDELRALIKQADMARKGEKVVVAKGDRSRPKACKVRRAGEGDDKWQRFNSRTDAVAAFPGLNNIAKLCDGTASAKLRLKFEARDVVDEGVPMSERASNALMLRALRLSFSSDVGSAAGALSVIQRAAWEVDGQPPPESWKDAIERLLEFSESRLRKFAAATGEAEAARVLQVRTVTLAGPARAAQNLARRQRMAASARATGEALRGLMNDGWVTEAGDLDVSRADDRDIKIRYLNADAPKVAGPVMIEYKGKLAQLKAGRPIERYALAPGNLVLALRGVSVATLERLTPNDTTYLTAPFARGTSGFEHAGEGGPYAATITPHTPPGDLVRGLAFCPLAAMAKVGFHAVAGTRTAAMTYDGDSIEDAGTIQFKLFLDGFEGDLMSALDDELFCFSEALLATSRADPRLREGVDASYRRDPTGSSRNPAFLFAQPCRADTGPTLRTLRGLEYLRTNDYPIMYEVARRCNWHCVRFELVAYRDVVPTRLRLHVDSMAELSISKGGMTSAALARA